MSLPCKQDGQKYPLPSNYNVEDQDGFIDLDAGRAYVFRHYEDKGFDAPAGEQPEPDHVFSDESAYYEVYPDCSLLRFDGQQTEVWADFGDFVTDSLIPNLACNVPNGLTWEKDHTGGFEVCKIDRDLIFLAFDGDVRQAKQAIGLVEEPIEYQITEVSDGVIHWSAGELNVESDLDDGWYVHAGDEAGDGPEAGPFENRDDAEAAVRELGGIE